MHKKSLKDKNVDIIALVLPLLNLNIMENIWVLLTRKVYSSGKQYQKLDTLKAAVGKAWFVGDKEYLKTFYQSLISRLLQVLDPRDAWKD